MTQGRITRMDTKIKSIYRQEKRRRHLTLKLELKDVYRKFDLTFSKFNLKHDKSCLELKRCDKTCMENNSDGGWEISKA